MPPQDPRELGSLEECRNRRLIAGLAGVVEEVVGTQRGLVGAVEVLERRARPPGARRFRPRASLVNVLVFALMFGVLFTFGSATLPEGPMPAAEAGTSRPPRKAQQPASTTQAQPVSSRPWAHRGVLQQPATTAPVTTLPAAAGAATVTSQPATTTTLPAATTTTLPELPPLTTRPCEPKGCGDED